MKCKSCLIVAVTAILLAIIGSVLILNGSIGWILKTVFPGENVREMTEHEREKYDHIRIISPRPGESVESPLVITGEARGNWFFEASFPVVLVDWDGRIIAEHYAEAQDEWMTESFVPFESTISFTKPYPEGENIPDFMKRGALILRKDNPSGLPEHDDALEIPIVFR